MTEPTEGPGEGPKLRKKQKIKVVLEVPAKVDVDRFVTGLRGWLRRYSARIVMWAPVETRRSRIGRAKDALRRR